MEQTKRCLLLTTEYPPDTGGVAEYLFGLVRHFPGEVCVVKGPFFWKLWPHWMRGVWTTWKAVRAYQPDLMCVSHVLPIGYFALLMRYVARTPYMVCTHGLDVYAPDASSRKRWWVGHILRNAVLVLANSAFTAERVRAYGVPLERIEVVYPMGRLFEGALAAEKIRAKETSTTVPKKLHN